MSGKVEQVYPPLSNPYLGRLIEKCPQSIGNQFLPEAAELEHDDDCPDDGLAEIPQSPLPRVIHRYVNRIVLLSTNRCAARCRFCFRKRLWHEAASDITETELSDVCNWLKRNKQVSEVLVSGGDPLTLGAVKLEHIIHTLLQVESVRVLRMGTRFLSVNPALFTDEIINVLKSAPNLWLMTHFNHGDELTSIAVERCRALASAGVPMLNQTVLLKGINDDARTLGFLFQQLLELKVKPHYLFHIDPVKGVRHFATGVEHGLDIMRELRSMLSSLAMPAYAIDLPEGGGKVLLQPDYRDARGNYRKLNGEFVKYPDRNR